MNKDRILELAAHIENLTYREGSHFGKVHTLPKNGFNMANFHFYGVVNGQMCKTPSCICGWAITLWEHEDEYAGTMRRGKEILDLTRKQAEELFFPYDCLEKTPEEAAETLRRLAATGVVKWPDTKQEKKKSSTDD